MDEDERQRKIEAGRAKLASFRQKRAKGDGQVAQKKTQKRKGPSPTQNDGPAQGRPLGMDLQTDGSATQQDDMCNNEEPQRFGETDPSQLPEFQGHLEQHHPQEGSSALGEQAVGGQPEEMEVVGDEVLVVHTGKDQLKQLQAAVEKRNEIISRLSCNLQEALESRDQVQQEAFSLTGQIQALKMQLQQTSQFFCSRTQGGSELSLAQQKASQPDHSSYDLSSLPNHLEVPVTEPGEQIRTLRMGHEQTGAGCESLEQCIDPEMDAKIHTLRRELLEEREKNQLMLSQLEEERTGREEERREIHQYKEENEVLNRELQELRRRLEEEARERRNEREDEREIRERQEEEKRRLGEEVQRVRQLLGKRGRTREELGFKASKDKLNQAKASVEEEDGEREGEEREECLLDVSLPTDGTPLLERYLSSALPSHSCWTNESLEECSLLEEHSILDNSGNYRFELDSDIVSGGDQSQLSFSQEEQTHFPVPPSTARSPDPENETLPSFASQWQNNPLSVSRDASETSERLSETSESQEISDLGKELLIQQCGDLREEVALREREKEVVMEELRRSAEDLEEARARWAQVSEELQEAHWELEEEREKRRRAEEEVSLKTHEEDNLKNRLCTLLEEREKDMESLISSPFLEEGGTVLPSQERVMEQLKEEKSLLLSHLKQQEELLSSVRLEKGSNKEKDWELREVEEEKSVLLSRLRQQEQLVSSLQEVKQAGDSVSSEVHALFGRQLQSLQTHRDQLLALLEETKSRHKTTTALLGQKTLELDTAQKEMHRVQKEAETARQEVEERERRIEQTEREKTEVESELLCLRQNLCNLEEVQAQGVREREEGRRREEEMDRTMRRMEKVMAEELEEFQRQLRDKEEEVEEEREKWEEERQEKDEEVQGVRRLLEEQRMEREQEVKALLEQQMRSVEEATERLRRSHSEDVQELQEKHQEEVSELSGRLERELCEQRHSLEEEQKRQISLIKQVNEREHQRMLSEMMSQQREELSHLKAELSGDQRESMEAAHQAELLQIQSQQALELEALRLSLTNHQTTQLELSQTNLQREREASLSELQASLREKWAQERAVLQARQQFEVERLRAESEERIQREQQEYHRNMDALRQECESRVSQERASMEERQAAEIVALRSRWQQESEKAQSELQTQLSEARVSLSTQAAFTQTGADLSEARASLEELQRLEGELNQAWTERDTAARAVEDLVSRHQVVLQEREEQTRQLQQEVCRLHGEQVTLRHTCDQEVSQLWAQLDNMRTSRQELGELKEQLLARSSRVDDIERLKAEFNVQRREINEQNEVELENLRRYFEQRLRVAEESYREEIALLQLRLVEGALEDSVLKTQDASFLSEGRGEEERNDVLAEITLKLEKHQEAFDQLRVQLEERHTQELSNLRSSMALSYREELLQVRSDLTDRYYGDLQELKTRHALEMEQLRARLSDSHVRELTRVRLEAARQVEVEVEHRMWCHSEELQTRTTMIQNLETRLAALADTHNMELRSHTMKLKQSFAEELVVKLAEEHKEERERVMEEMTLRRAEEVQRLRQELQEEGEARVSALREALERGMAEERSALEKGIEEARAALRSLQASLDNDLNPQAVAVRQRLEAQYEAELTRAKSTMAAEVKELTALLQEQGDQRLCQAQDRFQEEREELEQRLAQQGEVFLGELREEHMAAMEILKTTLLTNHTKDMDTLRTNHKAELDSLLANHKADLKAMAIEIATKHEELVVLETSLESKRKSELDHLEAVLQETNQAQLEAQEAELEHRHQEEREELEKRMLGNMDTLETTYLREIQTLRDQKSALEAKHKQEVERERSRLNQEVERDGLEQQSVREELRKELAQLHMEKFSAMATELSHTHQNELTIQKEALEAEHHTALEALRKKVLELAQQHCTALEELTCTYTSETQQLNTQHQQQLQELKSASVRELQACRRELEEESSRQRLHFLEEVELLKAQAEERLEQKISQLKAEFEEQKEAELAEQRQSFSSEHEQKEQSYADKMSQLTAQLLQLDTVVSQLRAEVCSLQGELEGKRSEMETLDTLLQRRERESQEGGNLLNMLTEDLHTAKEERQSLQSANERLRKVLVEVVLSTMAMEELIGRRVNACVGVNGHDQGESPGEGTTNQETGVSVADMSTGDLDLSQRVCESLLLAESQTNSGGLEAALGEEAALGACSQLRHSVDTLLELLTRANTQLEESCSVHLSLEERFSQGRSDSSQMLLQHQLVLDQLDQEAGLKSKLQLELHKAEGLLEGYVAEKATLEESLQQKEAQEERLVEELEGLRAQLHQKDGLTAELEGLRAQLHQKEGLTSELENLRVQLQELSEEHILLQRQKVHLTAGLGEREKGLLVEADRLGQERLCVQRQAEKDRSSLSLRLRALETELEEQENKGLTAEQQHRAQSEDLLQRVQALEKQLKHDRQFIDEQAVEREHERDEFQQEIRSLEAQLRQPARHSAGTSKGQRVESLQALIRDKTEDHTCLLAANQQVQLEVAERNEEIDKLAGRIRELEQALLSSSESSRAVSQLEQELHRARQREEELTQDKESLQQQQLSNRLQISALQSKLDETRHRYRDNNASTPDPIQLLRDTLDTAQQDLQDKEQQVCVLVGQMEETQRDLTIKEAELKHLTLQLELLTNQNTDTITQHHDQVAALKETVSALTFRLEEREIGEEESLPSALLEEKNEEIDHLTQEIHKLELELETARDITAIQTELEDVRSQVEHLRCDIIRVRQDKQEEEERLHEVISTLQAELNTLCPAYHEVSDLSQEGDSVNPSPAPSPEPAKYPQPERGGARGGEGDSLKQEMRLLHSSSSRSLRSRVEALQGQLEVTVGEKEAMERLLLSQEEEYRGQGEEMGRRLKEERERGEEVKRELNLKEAELEEVRARKEGLEEERDAAVEESGRWQALAQETNSLRGEKTQLDSLVLELKSRVEEREKETEALLQTVVAVETAKAELSSEREALRKRECRLQEEIERLQQEVTSQRACLQEVSRQLEERRANQEEAQKEVLTCAEETLAKADAALRQREEELQRLGAEHQALGAELAAVKEGLCSSTERAEKLLEEGQTKDRALADLETNNQHLKAELRGLQEDLAVQEEELAYQQGELLQLRQTCNLHSRQTHSLKDVTPRGFQDGVSRNGSLSSPEVLRRLDCSEERTREDRFHPSVLHGSRLSDLSALNSTGLELQAKASPRGRQDQPCPGTISPELGTHSTHSPGSISASDNLSMLDSMDADKVHELEALDLTAPPSSLGSASSLSATEWASDGYGSNVSSELGVRLKVELEQTERLDAQFLEYLRCRGMNPATNTRTDNTRTDSAAGSMSYSDELLSPELQGLLKRVYQESCRVLALSQRNAPSNHLSLDQTICQLDSKAPPMCWEQEKRALQETVIALRELLCRMAQRPENSVDAGWSRGLQAAVRGVFDCERAELRSELQAFLSSHPEIDSTHLLRQLETLLQRQEEQHHIVVERLLSADKHALQLQHSQWEESSKGEVLSRLRAELEENRERLNSSHSTQQELQNEIRNLRLCIEDCEEAVRREETRVQELQQELYQERTLTHLREKEEEQQRSEVVTLRGQLDQERTTSCNLRQELQIELSRGHLLQSQLDTRLADAHKELEEECARSARQLDTFQSQEKSRLEHFLKEAESRLADAHMKKLEEERERSARCLNDITRRQEEDASRDRKFISELRSQLEQERRQGEELATVTDGLRAELLQNRRRVEEEERKRRAEAQRDQDAAARLRVTMETLKEQQQEASRALETERERSGRLGAELNVLRERLRSVNDKEREREEQRERERRKERQEQTEREKRHERTSNKLCELELLRQQDQQRMRDLQQTLAELEREEREMATERLSNQYYSSPLQPKNNTSTGPDQTSTIQYNHQSSSSSALGERLSRENSDLSARVKELSQETVNLKHSLSCLERQLRQAQTENRPSTDLSNSKFQRLYERYLRAESFRKSLVYQKRYLLLLLGGFQDCEQATLCLIARMGAHPSPPHAHTHSPLSRFRAAVRAVIAISRLKFLTRKWQRVVRRGVTTTVTVNGHSTASRTEVLSQQQPLANHNSSPPTRDSSPTRKGVVSPMKSPFRLHNRVYSNPVLSSEPASSSVLSQDAERSLTDYIHHLENVQQRLGAARPVRRAYLAPPPSSPDMIGYWQRWLQKNRTLLYLSCLSPIYRYGPDSPSLLSYHKKSDR
ncbi:pericentrin-like isoform X7 [Oncorhynchus tshawytscha]|uniref:ELK domain-containing protein n=1 Tax=Oncorhynchus tshawytscha TaxID=74940 RepID=A0A8C8J834_ONCTS|nr:pericentrin-like isoform X7 [Oncorhynchus tshawytscha]